jgi:hypothetical protein
VRRWKPLATAIRGDLKNRKPIDLDFRCYRLAIADILNTVRRTRR